MPRAWAQANAWYLCIVCTSVVARTFQLLESQHFLWLMCICQRIGLAYTVYEHCLIQINVILVADFDFFLVGNFILFAQDFQA